MLLSMRICRDPPHEEAPLLTNGAPHDDVTGKTRFSRRLFSKHHRSEAIAPLPMRFFPRLFKKRLCVVFAWDAQDRLWPAIMFRSGVLHFDSKLDFSGIETSRAS